MADGRNRVQTMLDAAGLAPDEEARMAVATLYAALRPGVDALYELPEIRSESPALGFAAAPPLDSWSE